MKVKITKKIEDYIYCTIPKYNDEKKCCYIWGYIDGYFIESVYENYIVKEEHKEYYRQGFKDGYKDRLNCKDSKELKKEKKAWIDKLIINDALNKVETRNLSNEYLEYYNDLKEHGEIRLSDLSIKKQRR